MRTNKNKTSSEETKIIKQITGKRLELYQFLISNKHKDFGLRELQRKLHWSSVSLVDYHMKILVELDVVSAKRNNKYTVKSILPIGDFEDYILIGESLIPKNIIFLSFSWTFFVGSILLAIFRQWAALILSYFLFSLVILIKETYECRFFIRMNKQKTE